MDNARKYLMASGAVAIGVAGILAIVNAARHHNHTPLYARVEKGIDESLKNSKEAIDKATALIQQVIEHIKTRKS